MHSKKSVLAALRVPALVLAAIAAPSLSLAAQRTPPVPVAIVHPANLPREYRDATVKIAMMIDAQGVPHDVAPAVHISADLAQRLLPVVQQWRFTPACENGHPVAMRVVLPITLIDKDEVVSARQSDSEVAVRG